MYPDELTKPMIEELTSVGFTELKDAEAVVSELNNESGKCLVLVNSYVVVLQVLQEVKHC